MERRIKNMAKENKVYEESGEFDLTFNYKKWESEPMDKFTRK
jgi:hypothetical protein